MKNTSVGVLEPTDMVWRTCENCEFSKPVDFFKDSSKTCKLCSKLITKKLRVSSKCNSHLKDIGDDCDTCGKVISESIIRSNECPSCILTRTYTEYYQVRGFETKFNCRNCNEDKSSKDFGIGKVFCKTCERKLR